jgi:hypothetical protein
MEQQNQSQTNQQKQPEPAGSPEIKITGCQTQSQEYLKHALHKIWLAQEQSNTAANAYGFSSAGNSREVSRTCSRCSDSQAKCCQK